MVRDVIRETSAQAEVVSDTYRKMKRAELQQRLDEDDEEDDMTAPQTRKIDDVEIVVEIPPPSYGAGWEQGWKRGREDTAQRVLTMLHLPDEAIRYILSAWSDGADVVYSGDGMLSRISRGEDGAINVHGPHIHGMECMLEDAPKKETDDA